MKARMKQIWVSPEFKKFLYEKKAETPEKNIPDILDDLVSVDKEKKKRNVFPQF